MAGAHAHAHTRHLGAYRRTSHSLTASLTHSLAFVCAHSLTRAGGANHLVRTHSLTSQVHVVDSGADRDAVKSAHQAWAGAAAMPQLAASESGWQSAPCLITRETFEAMGAAAVRDKLYCA